MRQILLISRHLVNTRPLNVFQIIRNGFINGSEITKKCLYSTSTTNAIKDGVILPPVVSIDDKQYPQKISKIVNDISNLTLLEVSELNELLKKTLNIVDTPMMAMGAMSMSAPAGQAQEDEDEDIGSKTVQTSFTLKLNKFNETKKVALIKEIKAVVEGMNLVQAKKFVESVPQIIKSNLPKDEAEKLKAALEAVGGECVVE